MALVSGAVCLVTLIVGMASDGGTTMVGISIVVGAVSLVALADGTLKRLQGRRSPPAEG